MRRSEKAPGPCELAKIHPVMIGVSRVSYPIPSAIVTLDFDDTYDVIHSNQKVSFRHGQAKTSSSFTRPRWPVPPPRAGRRQIHLILHTADYWLLWRIQQMISRNAAPATAEFSTLRLFKFAAPVMKSAARATFSFAPTCTDADLFVTIVNALKTTLTQPARP
jgi:hypothetical protein